MINSDCRTQKLYSSYGDGSPDKSLGQDPEASILRRVRAAEGNFSCHRIKRESRTTALKTMSRRGIKTPIEIPQVSDGINELFGHGVITRTYNIKNARFQACSRNHG